MPKKREFLTVTFKIEGFFNLSFRRAIENCVPRGIESWSSVSVELPEIKNCFSFNLKCVGDVNAMNTFGYFGKFSNITGFFLTYFF